MDMPCSMELPVFFNIQNPEVSNIKVERRLGTFVRTIMVNHYLSKSVRVHIQLFHMNSSRIRKNANSLFSMIFKMQVAISNAILLMYAISTRKLDMGIMMALV